MEILFGLFFRFTLGDAARKSGDVRGKTAFGLSFKDRVDLHDLSVTACLRDCKSGLLRVKEAAEKIQFAVGLKSKRTLGFDAADRKAGFDVAVSDDRLVNFVINQTTEEVSCVDCLVKW